MQNRGTQFRNELNELIKQGGRLYYVMLKETGGRVKEVDKTFEQNGITLPEFDIEYDRWYSVALRVVREVLPERLEDFVRQYKQEKRKDITFLTYTISDFQVGLQVTLGGDRIADRKAAVPKMLNQVNILRAAAAVLDSAIADIGGVLQADLFDGELDAAKSLCASGHVRAAGALAGVVLEKHLRSVCEAHQLKTRKRNPGLADYNELLKAAKHIDVPTWRSIQHLADLRNLSAHAREEEPTQAQVLDLVTGVAKVVKTVH